jgi:hypothetical protein
MLNKRVILVCALVFLSGCVSNRKLANAWKEKTYGQLVAAQSLVKSVKLNGLNPRGDVRIGYEYFCYRCDGQPTRTYTNKAGNTVAVYFYWRTEDYPLNCDDFSCSDDYSTCYMVEQHFEIANGVVINAKYTFGRGDAEPLYSKACEGYKPTLANIKGNDD